MKGYVYILTNEHMPGLVKIGMTTDDPETRARQLYQTGVPSPFQVADCAYLPDCAEGERRLHDLMPDLRVSDSREFFRASIELASDLLRDVANELVDEWLNEFMPDHSFEKSDLMVDTANMCIIADTLGVASPDIADAMGEVTAEELAPALRRVNERRERWKAKRSESLSLADVVPAE